MHQPTAFEDRLPAPLRLGWRGLKWLGFLALYLLDGILLDAGTQSYRQPGEVHKYIGSALILSAILLLFFSWSFTRQLQRHNPRQIQRTRLTLRRALIFIGFFLLMMAVQWLWSWLISAHVLTMPQNQTELNQATQQLPFWNAIYGTLFAPVIEEYIFRGFFLNYFFSRATKIANVVGVLLSGLVFGYLHTLDFSTTWLMYSALGWVLGSTYLTFKDIRYNMFLHILNNAISYL